MMLRNPKVARFKKKKKPYRLKIRRLKVTKFFQSDKKYYRRKF